MPKLGVLLDGTLIPPWVVSIVIAVAKRRTPHLDIICPQGALVTSVVVVVVMMVVVVVVVVMVVVVAVYLRDKHVLSIIVRCRPVVWAGA
jgi:hypothetical protein